MATNPKQPSQAVEEIDPHLVEVEEIIDPGATPDDDISFEDLQHGEVLTTTESLHRHHQLHGAETVDAIVDLGVEVLDPEATTHIVRVHTDVGPVYYGSTDQPIELKKNRRYRVPSNIHRYLYERGLLVDQLVENPI